MAVSGLSTPSSQQALVPYRGCCFLSGDSSRPNTKYPHVCLPCRSSGVSAVRRSRGVLNAMLDPTDVVGLVSSHVDSQWLLSTLQGKHACPVAPSRGLKPMLGPASGRRAPPTHTLCVHPLISHSFYRTCAP
jgi:hypothetical protein